MKQDEETIVKLKIAGTIIEARSQYGLEQPKKEELQQVNEARFKNFFYSGKQKPHVKIIIKIVDKIPVVRNTQPVFITYHFQDGTENWRLMRTGSSYIYKSPLEGKEQLMVVNKTFDEVTAYVLRKKGKSKVWRIDDLIYDFLQVLLINYLALRKEGIFVHSVGIKDLDGRGLIFAGKSGCGKTTTAKLWDSHSRAMILNDDRIIVRKVKGKFLIYGSPWHGEFSDYLQSRIESAVLQRLFFIYHAPKNTVRNVFQKKAFNLLYASLFPAFWEKASLENIVSLGYDLISSVPCFRLGFVKDKKIIDFVRKI